MTGTAQINRWIVSLRLVTETPMEIRTGEVETSSNRPAGNQPGTGEPPAGDEAPEIAAIALDAKQRPYIPATAMKGHVRAALAAAFGDSEEPRISGLLGDLPRLGRDPEASTAEIALGGKAEFHDLMLISSLLAPDTRPPVLGKTAINPGTGSAHDKLLRHGRVVPEGTIFGGEIIIDAASPEEISLLCEALHRLDGQHGSAFGGRRRTGQGRVRLEAGSLSVKCLGPKEIAAWLAAPAGKSWRDCARTQPVPAASATRPPAATLRLRVDGFFLVSRNQPGPKDEAKPPEPREPRTVTRDGKTYPLLPGESLNGVLRAQSMRIWRTLRGEPGAARIPAGHAAPLLSRGRIRPGVL